jgi:hydroxypyruvate isomerase
VGARLRRRPQGARPLPGRARDDRRRLARAALTAPRFAANVSLLFGERPFLERPEAARRAGFQAVEFWWPHGERLDDVAAAVRDAGVEVALLNFDGGDIPAGERGYLNDPARVARFHEHVPEAIDLARAVGCRQLHALVGQELPGVELAEQLERARAALKRTARAVAPHGLRVLVEALSTYDSGPVLISRTAQASAFVRSVGEPNVALQYDVFHMQRMEGNIGATLERHIGEIAHVQVADAPGRGEPGTGEIRFEYVFERLAQLGYDGWVAAEYVPTTPTTEESLGWMRALQSAG